MKNSWKILLTVLLLAVVALAGCSSASGTLETVSPEAAAEVISENPNAIILDIRTPEEFYAGTIEGSIINRSPQTVNNVRVQFEAAIAGADEPWRGEVPVTSSLPPDEIGSFSHSFAGEAPEGRAHPDVRTSVIWTRVETRREPSTQRSQFWGGGTPDPGSLPVQVGGVTGADVRPTPVIDD